MASQLMHVGAKEFGRDLKKVHVRIYPQNTSDPVVEHDGGVASVGRSGAGKFLVTLNDSYFQLKHANVSYRDERDNADLYAQLGAASNEGTSSPLTIVVKLKTATTNTDVAAGSGAKDRCIYCEFEFEDSAP